jgi:hypothetical protein
MLPRLQHSQITKKEKNWYVPFGTQRVETEGLSRSEDNEKNPKADSHPGTNQV